MKKYIRKLQRDSSHSYSLNIPKELVKDFKWKEKQKLEIIFGGRKHDLLIRDWPARRSGGKKTKKKQNN